MGSSASKAAKTVSEAPATNVVRKYPTRTPHQPRSKPTNAQPPRSSLSAGAKPPVGIELRISERRHQALPPSSNDPDQTLNARLRALGPVTPSPTLSNTSTFNFSPPLSHSDRATTNALSSSQFPPSKSSNPTSPPNSRVPNHDPSLTHTQFSPSASTPAQSIFPTAQNPAVSLLTARYRLAEEAEKEFAGLGKRGAEGRTFLDVQTLRQILVLRGEGMRGEQIEERLGLRSGVVGRLGGREVVGVVG